MLTKNYGPEERLVMKMLDMYGPLYEQQLINYIANKPADTVKRLINKLVTQHEIYRCGVEGMELTRNPTLNGVTQTNNQKRQRAFWVLLGFINSGAVSDNDHMQSTEPSQIFFYRRNDLEHFYEIVNIDDQEEALTAVMLKNLGKTDSKIKLICVIENEKQVNIVNKYVPNVFAFAFVETKIEQVTDEYGRKNIVIVPTVRVVGNKKKPTA